MKRVVPGEIVSANAPTTLALGIMFIDDRPSCYTAERIGNVAATQLAVVIACVDDAGSTDVDSYALLLTEDRAGWRNTSWFDPVVSRRFGS